MHVDSIIIKVFAMFSYHVSLHTSLLLAILHDSKILLYLMKNDLIILTNHSWLVVRSMCFTYAENVMWLIIF